MAIAVRQVEGCYVFSSPPKVLLKPVFPQHQRMSSSRKYSGGSSPPYEEHVLYYKPSARNSGLKHDRTSSGKTPRTRRFASEVESGNYYGDSPCPPVPGRQHMTVQTDLYLEELLGVVEETDVYCQTDPLLDRPASPLFVPAKIGVDVATQIWPGELFDFDREVQPLLEALVGQTLEQAIIEIMAEEELAILLDMQHEFEERRNVELAERQRLEEQERRLCEERDKRLKEQDEAVQLEEEVSKKIAASVFAQNYLSDLVPQMYARLEEQGYMATQDTVKQEIEETFWPWLMDQVDGEVTTLEASCSLLDSLIEETVGTLKEQTVIRPVTPLEYPKSSADEQGTVEEDANDEDLLLETTEAAEELPEDTEEGAETEETTDIST